MLIVYILSFIIGMCFGFALHAWHAKESGDLMVVDYHGDDDYGLFLRVNNKEVMNKAVKRNFVTFRIRRVNSTGSNGTRE